MRGKRAKQYRKLMHQYSLAFNFREPYQVLVDAAIIQDAARFKMRLGGMLESTLHGSIKPMITQCCIRHLYALPATPDKEGWIAVAKAAERRRCGHHELETPLSARECLESVVDPKASNTNKHRYVVASQDPELRRAMRAKAGVPLVYIHRSVMILEPMARASEDVKEREEKAKFREGLSSRRGGGAGVGEKRKREDAGGEDGGDAGDSKEAEPVQKKRKARGPKEPNPLSVKKSKKVKSVAKPSVVEDGVVEKAAAKLESSTKQDEADTEPALAGSTEGTRKRKRKRKAKDSGGDSVVVVDGQGGGDLETGEMIE